MLQVWFIRRALYSTMRVPHAAAVSFLYSTVLLGGVWVLKRAALMTPSHVYGAFVLASLACMAYYRLVAARKVVASTEAVCPVRAIVDKHWHFGKWLVIASLASTAATLLYAPILGLMSLLKEAAAYKAIQNLSLPFGQLLTSFYLLLLPVTSKVVRDGSPERVRRHIQMMTAAFAGAACVYGVVMVLWGKQILWLLYANEFYVEYAHLIPVFALVLVVMAVSQSLATAVRAYESSRTILSAKVSSALVVLPVIVMLAPVMKLKGILLGMCLGALAELVVLGRFFLRRRQEGRV